jgi:ABC-type transporter MlaC component
MKIPTLNTRVLGPLLVALVLALMPAFASAQDATPSKLVLENSQRILSTLEKRRDEFQKDRGALEAFIASELQRSGGEPIPVDYLMRKSGGTWKVFDVMVEGVSFVQTFRQQFDNELTHKSIKQVAADLRNGQLQADAKR